MNTCLQNSSMYHKRVCNCTQRSSYNFDLSVHFLMFMCSNPSLAVDNANAWEDVELRIYPDPFCISCQIYSINKKARSKISKTYGMEKISTEEMVYKLDIFQSRFEK